jgi:hypothetical protein
MQPFALEITASDFALATGPPHRRIAISRLAGTLNSAAWASKAWLGASSSVAPTTGSIGAPIADPSVGSIRSIKRMKCVSSTAWPARATIKIMTDVSSTFPVVNGRSLIGWRYAREPTGTNNGNRGRQYETTFSHSILADLNKSSREIILLCARCNSELRAKPSKGQPNSGFHSTTVNVVALRSHLGGPE